MKADGDNLMVVPVEPLNLWQAGIKHATKYPYYSHKVNLYVQSHKIVTGVDFSDYQKTPLLGRDRFFSFFKYVKIDQNKKRIELKY